MSATPRRRRPPLADPQNWPRPALVDRAVDDKSFLSRCAITTTCEDGGAPISLGEEVDLDAYGRAASHLRRILETLGLERKARDVTVDGVEVLPFSPMRQRWAEAEAAAAAKEPTS